MNTTQTVAIAGGGAAGLMAAISAATSGARVTIFEKMSRTGLKLLITGNGRCNLSTLDTPERAAAAFGPNGRFLRGAFSRFFSNELVHMLQTLGVPVTSEPGRGYYPASNRAADVAAALIHHATELGVQFHTGAPVESVIVENGHAAGLIINGTPAHAHTVILATGGASYPKTGSTGDGYRIAAALGHTISPPMPACVPLLLTGELHKRLAPLTFPNVEAQLHIADKPAARTTGGILFTPWGATGPAALALGKQAAAAAAENTPAALTVNFLPGHNPQTASRMLADAISSNGSAPAANALNVFFPKRAAAALIDAWGIDPGKRCAQITTPQRDTLAALCTTCRFTVTGTRPIEEAMVTAGGVTLTEIDPKTMQSKLIPGLFICGELLNLDAGTGGYNLQAAFSTGFTAGLNAAAI